MLVVIINIKSRAKHTFVRVKVRVNYTFTRIKVCFGCWGEAVSDVISRRLYQQSLKSAAAIVTRHLAQFVVLLI